MPVPGFSGLSKATTKTPAAAPAAAAKAPAPVAKAPSLLKQAQAEIKIGGLPKTAPPASAATKTRAQILREQAAAAEAEEAAALEGEQIADEVMAEAVPETEAETRAVSTRAGNFGLSVPRKEMANALLAFVQTAETKKVPSLFPTLLCSGGAQGGLWVSPSWQGEDIAANLPQGKKPIRIHYLGYRIDVSIWPREYNEANPSKDKPVASGVVPCNESELAVLATKAVKNYQFTKKAAKVKFDVDAENKGAGRPNCSLEIIGYLPEIEGLIVLRTAPGFGPVSRTMGNLAKLIDAHTGEIPAGPVTVKTDTESESNSDQSQSWKTHFFDFTSDLTTSGKATWDAFNAFSEAVKDDAEFMAKFNDWMMGADKPMTEDTANRLRLAASL